MVCTTANLINGGRTAAENKSKGKEKNTQDSINLGTFMVITIH
jgi:hypothetical protein